MRFAHLEFLIVPAILAVKGIDRLEMTLKSLRDDYRKVNSLDEREESELDGQF